jgi:hypothetical protein
MEDKNFIITVFVEHKNLISTIFVDNKKLSFLFSITLIFHYYVFLPKIKKLSLKFLFSITHVFLLK